MSSTAVPRIAQCVVPGDASGSQARSTGEKLIREPSRSPFKDRMFMSIGMSGTNWLYEA